MSRVIAQGPARMAYIVVDDAKETTRRWPVANADAVAVHDLVIGVARRVGDTYVPRTPAARGR